MLGIGPPLLALTPRSPALQSVQQYNSVHGFFVSVEGCSSTDRAPLSAEKNGEAPPGPRLSEAIGSQAATAPPTHPRCDRSAEDGASRVLLPGGRTPRPFALRIPGLHSTPPAVLIRDVPALNRNNYAEG